MTRPATMVATTMLWIAASAMTSLVDAQVYKCQDAGGKTIYTDAPCASGGKPLRLQDPTTPAATNATACGQLLDETRRLAAEAQRDAKRGGPVDTSNAKRRQTLAGEYQRRCAGISRSAP